MQEQGAVGVTPPPAVVEGVRFSKKLDLGIF